jgi:hypothetical protein
MEVKGRHVYAQGVETVFRSFGDKARIAARFHSLGARNVQIAHCKLTKTTLDMTMTREMPVDAPGLLKKFLGEWNQSTQEEHWTGSAAKGYTCDLVIVLKGVPVTVTGRFFLSGDATQCVNDVTMTFESGIPLVGKKLADFVGTQATAVMQKEYEFIRDSF